MSEDQVFVIDPKDGGPPETIGSHQGLTDWVNKEINYWTFVQEDQKEAWKVFLAQLHSILAHVGTITWTSDSQRYECRQQILADIRELRIVRSKSAFATDTITSIRKKGTPTSTNTAAACTAFYMRLQLDAVKSSATVEGVYCALAFEHGLPSSGDSLAEKLGQLMTDVEKRTAAQEAKLEAVRKGFDKQEELYQDYMMLRMPKGYWTSKKWWHELAAAAWGVAFALGVWGAGWFVVSFITKEMLEMDTTSFRPWVAIRALALATLGIWVLRILARNFASHMHLAMDASERGTMIETYLALEKDNRLSPADKSLILSPLFRPTSDGLVKDDPGPFGFLQDIAKIIKR